MAARTIRRLLVGALALGLIAFVGSRLLAGGDPDAPPAAAVSSGDASFADRTVRVGAEELHLVIGGSGPPVLLISGFPETWYAWRKLMPALARHHTVIAVDPPGVGDSSIPREDPDARASAAALAELLERLDEPRAAVVGHDLGGWSAYALARFHPGQVSRLAILGAGIPGFGLERRLDYSAAGRGSLWQLVFFMQPAAAVLLEGQEEALVSGFLAPDEARAETFDGGALEEYVRALSRPGRLEAALAPYRTFYRDLADNRAAGAPPLRLPVLGLDGERAAGELNLRTIRRAAPRARTELVPAAGHFFPEERPGYVARRLLRFLR